MTAAFDSATAGHKTLTSSGQFPHMRHLHQETFSSASILEARLSLRVPDKADFILMRANVCAITDARLIDLIALENIVHNIFFRAWHNWFCHAGHYAITEKRRSVSKIPERSERAEDMIPHGKRKNDQAAAQAEVGYQLELARGASVIASMLSTQNMAAAVEETLSAFVRAYGTTDLKIFTQLLGQRLTARNRMDAADMLFAWKPASPACAARSPAARQRDRSR
jgi:hypothetical protein